MRDIQREPTPRGNAGAAGEVAILHPRVEAFLDALAAWQLRKALDRDATAVGSGGPSGHAPWDDVAGTGGRRGFGEASGPRTSDTAHAEHLRR